MTEFILDTSGYVPAVDGGLYYFRELDPFAQGYVEALFASFRRGDIGHWPDHLAAKIGFSDLAPETLAAILKDCAAYSGPFASVAHYGGGQQFWKDRAAGLMKRYPPLTAYLIDGKLYLK